MRLHAGLLFAFGCGRIAFDPLQDVGDAGELACSPWSDPVEVTALTTGEDDWEPALSPDGNVLVFMRGDATYSLYAATRTGATFSAPVPLSALMTGGETGPTWAPTSDQLLFVSGGSRLYTSDYVGGVFQAPVEVAELAAVQITAPTLSGDGLELYYTDERPAEPARIVRATRANVGAPWMLAGSEPALELPDDGSGWASISHDGLTIYFEGKLMREPRIWRATRASTAERFGAPTRIEELAAMPDLVAAGDPELSRDGTMLLFSRMRTSTTTGFDIVLSTRTCP